MRSLFRALAFLFLFTAPAAQSQDLSMYVKKEFVGQDGSILPYRILFPSDYDKTHKYPLILVLHGAGERGSDNEKQLVHGAKLFVDSLVRNKYPAIVVFPQCPAESYWSSVTIDREKLPLQLTFDYTKPVTVPLKNAISLVQQLLKEDAVDTKRIYITGLSMGGMGTFEAVYRYPDVFAAALPICGGGDTLRYKRVKVPFWVFHGGDDAVVDVKYSRAMVNKLKDLKVRVKYTEYPGVNHNSWDNAFAEPDFLKWMFQNKK
jgi:predicted peptidase